MKRITLRPDHVLVISDERDREIAAYRVSQNSLLGLHLEVLKALLQPPPPPIPLESVPPV